MTEKLYYEDQYIKEFDADIEEIKEEDGKFKVLLDKTAFFPGGGGQDADKGTIDSIEVTDMVEEGDKIYHVLEKKPENLKKLHCKIDWQHRLDGMQQHLGQHVLSGVFYKTFNANTAGIHLGKDISYVDIIGHLTLDQIKIAEKKANKVIGEKHEVHFLITDRAKAKTMGLRRQLATNDDWIRIVKIEGLDINACCGVHPGNTLELQMIKIKSFEKHKGNTRVYFLAGNRAVEEFLNRDTVLDELCLELTTGYDEAVKSLKSLKNNLEEAREENKKLKISLSDYETKELVASGEKAGNLVIITKKYSNENMKFLNKLAEKITAEDNRVVLFATEDKEKANLLFASSKNLKDINMGSLLKDSISLIDGRGGGNSDLAQGGGKNILNLQNALDYAVKKVKEGI